MYSAQEERREDRETDKMAKKKSNYERRVEEVQRMIDEANPRPGDLVLILHEDEVIGENSMEGLRLMGGIYEAHSRSDSRVYLRFPRSLFHTLEWFYNKDTQTLENPDLAEKRRIPTDYIFICGFNVLATSSQIRDIALLNQTAIDYQEDLKEARKNISKLRRRK